MELGSVHFFQRISKSEQCSDFCWPTHPPPKSEQTKQIIRRILNFIIITPTCLHLIQICCTCTNLTQVGGDLQKVSFVIEKCTSMLKTNYYDQRILKSEHQPDRNPPTHPNPNIVRILKSVEINGRSLIGFSGVPPLMHNCGCIIHSRTTIFGSNERP